MIKSVTMVSHTRVKSIGRLPMSKALPTRSISRPILISHPIVHPIFGRVRFPHVQKSGVNLNLSDFTPESGAKSDAKTSEIAPDLLKFNSIQFKSFNSMKGEGRVKFAPPVSRPPEITPDITPDITTNFALK